MDNASRTSTKVRSYLNLVALQKRLDLMHASGLVISLQTLNEYNEGTMPTMESTEVAAEDCGQLVEELVAVLRLSLIRRSQSLNSEIRSVQDALGSEDENL